MPAGVRAGKAFVEIHGDLNPLSRALKRIGPVLNRWGAGLRQAGIGLSAAATSVLAPLALATRAFAAAGDNLHKMSQRTGISADNLSALSHAAELSGANVGELENGIRRLQRSASEAADGTASYAEAFDRLGVSTTDASGQLKPTEQLLLETADALARMDNHTQKAALAQEIFGRAGTRLLPMLDQGAAGINAMMQEARDLGLVLNDPAAAAAAELTDALTRLQTVLKRVWQTIGEALSPAVTQLANAMAENIKPVIEWTKANGALVVAVAGTAAAVLTAGLGLIAMGAALSAAGTIAGMLAGVIGAVTAAAAALISPIGLVVAGLTALAAWGLHASGALDAAFSAISGYASEVADNVLASFGAMKDALAGGDWKLAAQILWTTLKVEWQRGTAPLTRLWLAWKHSALSIVNDTWSGIRALWVEGTANIQKVWSNTATVIANTFDAAAHYISEGIAWLISQLTGMDPDKIAAKLGTSDKTYRNRIRNRNTRNDRALSAIEAQRRASRAGIDADRDRRQSALDSRFAGDSAATAASLRELQAELDAYRDQAARVRRDSEQWQNDPFAGLGADDPRAFDADEFAAENPAASSRGTFSAAAAVGLRSGDEMARTADATEETAQNTGNIARDLLSLVPTFS